MLSGLARKPQNREMLALPGGGRERRERRLALEAAATTADDGDLPRKLSEDEDFDPETGDVVKFFNAFAGDGGTTYTATIMGMEANAEGKMEYSIKYEDESTHHVTRKTFLETLSSMPQPARKFVEFGHDELKLIWEPDVHITNLHQAMNTHEEVSCLQTTCPHLPDPALLYSYCMHAERGVIPLRTAVAGRGSIPSESLRETPLRIAEHGAFPCA